MKKIILTLLISFIGAVSIFLPRQASAQIPPAFKYQAVVRDNSGGVIVGQLVSIRIGIVKDSINGTLIYRSPTVFLQISLESSFLKLAEDKSKQVFSKT